MNVFSSCWNARRHEDGYAMCEEILGLGFSQIELSHGLSLALVPGILQALEEGLIEVAGVHNFCPSPLGIRGDSPDVYTFTSHRAWERQRALQLSCQSLDFSAQLGARYMVLHLGCVEPLRDKKGSRQLEALARSGWVGSKVYARLKNKLMRQRARLAPLYFERARVALHKLADHAARRGICLGVESRSHMEQIPNEDELALLMEEFKDCPSVAYWHDFGHVQRKHNLLELNHAHFLRRMKGRILGAHVNDVRWPTHDHRAPFTGGDHGVNFAELLPLYFKKDMPLCWELARSVKATSIRTARKHWDLCYSKLF